MVVDIVMVVVVGAFWYQRCNYGGVIGKLWGRGRILFIAVFFDDYTLPCVVCHFVSN